MTPSSAFNDVKVTLMLSGFFFSYRASLCKLTAFCNPRKIKCHKNMLSLKKNPLQTDVAFNEGQENAWNGEKYATIFGTDVLVDTGLFIIK